LKSTDEAAGELKVGTCINRISWVLMGRGIRWDDDYGGVGVWLAGWLGRGLWMAREKMCDSDRVVMRCHKP
jgi:hypothetical protein